MLCALTKKCTGEDVLNNMISLMQFNKDATLCYRQLQCYPANPQMIVRSLVAANKKQERA